jgi:DNA repair protein RadD
LANVNVLTTGFDATNVDCVVLLRPTASVGLYVQMVGRGTRLHPGKEDCLVLDYGDNVLRHGPVDMIKIEEKTPGTGEPPAKECPHCLSLVHAAYMTCPECGHEFPPRERETHDEHATTEGILSGEVTDSDYDVSEVNYSVHTKRGADEFAPKTLRIEYQTGWNQWTSEWVCPEHDGWARQKFEKWWSDRSSYPPPETAQDAVALANDGALAVTKAITVRSIAGERFDRVIRYELGEKPDYVPEPGWNDGDSSEVDERGLLPSDNWAEIPF